MPADSAPIAEEMLSKPLIDNSDLWFVVKVPRIKITSFQERNAHRREILRRHCIHESLHGFAVFGLMAFNGRRTIPLTSMKEWHDGIGGGPHTRNRPDVFA